MTPRASVALAALLLVSCAAPRATPPPTAVQAATSKPAAATAPGNARALGVSLVGFVALGEEAAQEALTAFRISCPALLARDDASGLTRPEDWRTACAAADRFATRGANIFFADHFEMAQVGDGAAFSTGYFEPEIEGSRVAAPGYAPVYRKPPDLLEADLGRFSESLKGRKVRGRIEGGFFIPYHDRTAIEAGALANKRLEIAWAVDPIELFFLQIQGSGRLKMPDGSVMRIGYESQNGREYVAVGRLLRERGLLPAGGATMDGIIAWMRAQPDKGAALMRENPSYVFFHELIGPGPLGALGLPVTARASVAADPAFVPLGAPVLLSMEDGRASGLWIAQDTGGAIKGANRFDTFWGAGAEARKVAGEMSSKGSALILLPKGTVERLNALAPR